MVNERGFTLVEFLIATAIVTAVLGGTVAIASQMQRAYTTQLDAITVEEEARFSIDWIETALRSAGSNPYKIGASACAAATFLAIRMDPDGDGVQDDIRINADINPPNGLLGGVLGTCNESNEDVTISFDSANSVITRRDNNTDGAAVVMTEPVITDVAFAYLNSAGATTTNANLASYVRVTVTGKSLPHQRMNTSINNSVTTTTLQTEVHIRTRS